MKTTAKFTIAAAALAVASPAVAQDTIRDWTGPYVGGQLGYAFQPNDNDEVISFDTNQDGSFGDQVTTAPPASANAFSPGFCGGAAVNRTPAAGCRDDFDKVNWRVHVGYDRQIGSLVFGGVGEFGRTHTVEDAVTAFSTTPAFYTMSREYRYGANLRARAGYAFGDFLVYGTGGGSYAKVRKRFASSNTLNAYSFDRRDDAYGYNYGGGIEFLTSDNFSIGALFLHTSLEDKNRRIQVTQGTAPATNPFILANPNGTTFRRSDKRFNINSVNVTASVRF